MYAIRARWIVFAATFLAFAGNPVPPSLKLIDRLDESVQVRFRDSSRGLGMSRVAVPPSLGEHFRPIRSSVRDFNPESAEEKSVIEALEMRQTQVGLFLFGKEVNSTPAAVPEAPSFLRTYRGLKGPAVITAGTPRPAWYPPSPRPQVVDADALPDWAAAYSLAQKAMKSFEDGAKGFETKLQGWDIAARPVIATEQRCVGCHGGSTVGQALGGVLYAFREGGTHR